MGRVLVDSCVLLDVIKQDPAWAAWSEKAIEKAAEHHELVINPFIYAEVSMHFARIEDLDESLSLYEHAPLPYEAGFLAGKAFLLYRQRGGRKRAPLPDFYIGAHAAIEGMTLLTRDAARFRTYFPKLHVVAPP